MDLKLGYQILRTLVKPFQRPIALLNFSNWPRINLYPPFSTGNALVLRARFSTEYRKRDNRSSTFQDISISTAPKSLVCKRCWDGIFSTKDWEHACLGIKAKGQLHPTRVEHTTSIRNIKRSAQQSCSLCSLLWEHIGPDEHVNDFDAKYTVSLGESRWDKSTPIGRNTWFFSLHSGPSDSGHMSWSRLTCAFTAENDRAAKFVTARPMQRDVFSTAAQEQMRSWMHECAGHQFCTPQEDVTLPTRVIDVRPDDDPDVARVIVSDGKKGKYAALSYSWGDGLSEHQLNASNISQYMQHMDVDSLPATIRDGIAVTRAIGVKYLWIHSMCIVQDSKVDKVTELAKMEEYYRNSLVTIVAASSADASQGFLQPRKRQSREYACSMTARESWRLPYSVGGGEFGIIHMQCLECEAEHTERDEPINKRAWALQEQLLPPRQLVFSTHTLQWRCKTSGTVNLDNSNHYERYSQDEASAIDIQELGRSPHEPIEAFIRWMTLVNVYSHGNLNVHSDKLPAISSAAKPYENFLGKYYAGMWEQDLLWQLRWTTSRHEDDAATWTACYSAPSWSWASMNGPIFTDYEPEHQYQVDLLRENKPLCELVHVETQPKNPELPYGEVTGGHLVLRGKLRHGWLLRSELSLKGPRTVIWTTDEDATLITAQAKYDAWANQEEYIERDVYDDYVDEWIDDDKNPWIGAQHDLRDEHHPMKVACLPLYKDFGLVLQPTADGNYRRVGSFGSDGRFDWKTDFEQEETVEVKIL